MAAADKGFKFHEHTADIYVEAYGEDLAEAFENAASATFETMTDLENVDAQVADTVEICAEDEYALLYSWLEALIIKFDTSGNLYSRFKISLLSEREGGFKLKAQIWGEPFDPEKHVQKVGVKAVTYHRMEITRKPSSTTVKFLLDI